MPVTFVSIQDVPALVKLINSAYRGEASTKGWTTEAHLLKGSLRTDETTLLKELNEPGAVMLKYTNDENSITGCVYLKQTNNALYLGMLSVSPLLQAKGIGKQLMQSAEAYARSKNCSSIYMMVISVRQDIIAWYNRHGYVATGETKPFPTDHRFGIPTQPLEFIVLEKKLNPLQS